MAQRRPTLQRLLVQPDGEVHATFSDHSAIIINHTATVLAIVHPNGNVTRQLSQCVTSAYREKATQALHARNTLCIDAPRMQWGLLPPDRPVHYFDASSRPQHVSWPDSVSEAVVHHFADGAVRVMSLDRLAWLLLHPDHHIFAVCFPAPADTSDLAEPHSPPSF